MKKDDKILKIEKAIIMTLYMQKCSRCPKKIMGSSIPTLKLNMKRHLAKHRKKKNG